MNKRNLRKARTQVGKLENQLIDGLEVGAVSRRQFLVRGSVLGMSAGLMGTILAACGSDDAKTTGGSTAASEPAASDAPAASSAPPASEAPVTETTAPAATETTAPPASGGGDSIRIASQAPAAPLDPVAMADLGTYTVVTVSFEYLCQSGEGAALAPMLAESWKPNDDGSVWTFSLRKGVKWHDGGDFTAKDVVASLDRLAEQNLKAYIDKGSAKAIDDYTVEVTLKGADGQWPYQVSVFNAQAVITPESFVAGSTLDAAKTGTGAYKIESYDQTSGATFVANEDWWAGSPTIKNVEFVFSADLGTQVAAMASGEVDAIVQFSALGGEALLDNTDITVEAIRGAAHRQIWMNVREGQFTDKRVRQAVALGLDRQVLIDTLFGGKADMGNDHPIAPVYEYWDSSQPQRTRDVEKAKALLKEAGKEGMKATLYAVDLQEIPQLAELVQSQLKDIGMEVTLEVASTDVYLDNWCKVYDSKNEPAGCDGGQEFGIIDWGNRGTPDVYLVKSYATGEWNSSHYNDADFNALVKEYQASLDLDGRKAACAKIQPKLTDDVPFVIPYFYSTLIGYKKNITGIKATGLGHFYVGKATIA